VRLEVGGGGGVLALAEVLGELAQPFVGVEAVDLYTGGGQRR
jgi:hypothetical protein